MEFELATRMRPQAVEILGLVESAATGPVDRARRSDCLDFETAEELLAFVDRSRNRLLDYLRQVGAAEGRKPYLLAGESGA